MSYSNDSCGLISDIVRRYGGEPSFSHYIVRHILEPLEMRRSPLEFDSPRRAGNCTRLYIYRNGLEGPSGPSGGRCWSYSPHTPRRISSCAGTRRAGSWASGTVAGACPGRRGRGDRVDCKRTNALSMTRGALGLRSLVDDAVSPM